MTLAICALVLASIADVLTTRRGLAIPGVYEGNPCMRWATRTTRRAFAVKAAGLLLALGPLAWMTPGQQPIGLAVVWSAAILTALAAYRNFSLAKSLTESSCAPAAAVVDSATPGARPLSSPPSS